MQLHEGAGDRASDAAGGRAEEWFLGTTAEDRSEDASVTAVKEASITWAVGLVAFSTSWSTCRACGLHQATIASQALPTLRIH